jgi:hypothetical protein
MKHSTKNESYNYKNKISLVVLLIAIAWFIYSAVNKGNINKKVYKNGEVINAFVNKTKKVGGKGIVRCNYYFFYNNVRYEGWVDNDNYKVGDTIVVKFLKENPNINRDKKFLDRIE